MSPLRLNLLGGFEARRAPGPAIILARRKAQALLAYLAVQPGQVHLRDKLAALLWGDTTDGQARHSLRQALLAIKQAVPSADGDILVIGTDSVRVNQAAVEVDVAVFEGLVAQGTAEALRQACALYRGEFLEGVSVQEAAFEEWMITQRERLREVAVEALAKLLAHHVEQGLIAPAIPIAARLLSLDPLQEAVHRTLMRLYARQGRRGVALRQYQVCVDVMQRELGVEPEAKTRLLYQEILEGGPGADPVPVAPAPSASSIRQDGGDFGTAALPSETPLVGREAEIATLREVWDQVGQRRGRTAVVLGEAGTGKSRLVADVVGDVLARGGRVLVGRAHDSERILPFGPWADALRSGRVIAELAAARDANEIWVAELARLFPELGVSTRAVADAEDYVRLFEAIAQVIGRLAAERPLLLVLEDLHWADEMTLRLLAFVSRRVAEWPVLLVATARSEDIIDAPLLRRALVELNGEAGVLALTLSPLTQPHTVALVRTLCRAGTDDPIVRRLGEQIWRVSEGNPFMVVETMHALYEDEAGHGDELRTPPRVRDVIASRLERLSERGRQLAAIASVVGRELDFALLDGAAAIGTHAAAEGVEELVARRILHVVGERLDFTHDRIREVTYDQLIAPRRGLVHAAVAAAIEALYPSDLESHCVALATHWRRAGRWEQAVPYLRQAGETAARRSAHRQAMAFFEQALEALGHLPSRRDLLEQAIDLRFALRNSCVAVGAIAQIPGHLREAEATAEALGDRLRLGWVLAYRTSSHLLLAERDEAMQSGQRAVAIAGDLAEPKLRIAAHLFYGMTCHAVGQYQRAADLMRQSIGSLEGELTGRGDRAAQQIYTRTGMACSLAELGGFAEGLAHGEEAIRIAETAGRTYGLSHACFGLGFLHLRQGDLRRALSVLERGLSLCHGQEAPLLAAAVGGMLGYGYALSGELTKGVALLDDSVRIFQPIHSEAPSLVFLVEAQLLSGRIEEAQALAQRAIALTRERSERGYEAWALRLLADAAARDTPVEAEGAYQTALALAEELGMIPLQAHCRLGRGRLRRRVGDHERARADLAACVDLFRSTDMSLWLAPAEAELRQIP